jgi:hypothetical protein
LGEGALNGSADTGRVEVGAGGVDGDGHQFDQFGRKDAAVEVGGHAQELLQPFRIELIDDVPRGVEQSRRLHLVNDRGVDGAGWAR